MRNIIRALPAALGGLLAALNAAAQQQPEDTYALGEGATAAAAKKFMIAAAHPQAAQAGFAVLKNGGGAIDAAIAVQMMLNLVEPQSSGIGGGAFLLYWDAANKKLHTFDGRETAPAAADGDYFLDENGEPPGFWDALADGKSVGAPGTLLLLETAHKKFGKKPWAQLLQPAIDAAESGFPISPRLAASIKAHAGDQRRLDKFAAARDYFFNQDGAPKAAKTILKNPAFAATLREIADGGAAVFYRGQIARDIAAVVNAHGGALSAADIAAYQVKERPPVCINYRDYEVCGMGPPTSGGITVAQILGMLSHYDLAALGPGADSAHLFAEAARLAYADRAKYIADDDFVKVPTAGLLNPDYLAARAGLINPDKAGGKAAAGNPPGAQARLYPDESATRPGTSHFVIADANGDVLSMTTTIETGFGSRLMARGFLLNNELTDFSFLPQKDGALIANRVAGGKRPRSSMAPTIIFQNGEPRLAIGSPGGSRIINYVAKSIIAVLDWKMPPQEAINLGHYANRNGATDLEQNTAAAAFAGDLTARGHKINIRDLNSGLHAILINNDGELRGGADPRREGIVLGE